jgi:ATP-dependent Clp protease protease subunit
LRFWNFVQNQDEEIELRIDGDIAMDDDFWSWLFPDSTVTPKGFMAELAQYKGRDITVWINSYGGDVYAASRIYTALKEHQGKVKAKVDGVAISAASVIAMAGDEVMMSPTSIMMIHNPWAGFVGEAKDLRHGADILDEVKETIVNAYQLKTGRPRNKISQLMDEETWMGAKKAVAEGFADGVLYAEGEPVSAQNSLMFSRMAVQNSAADSMRQFIAEYTRRMAALKPPGELEEKRQAPLDLYSHVIKNHERRLRNA